MRLTAGNDFYVAGLDTAQGNVKIGSMICYDREFPESARILMLKGKPDCNGHSSVFSYIVGQSELILKLTKGD